MFTLKRVVRVPGQPDVWKRGVPAVREENTRFQQHMTVKKQLNAYTSSVTVIHSPSRRSHDSMFCIDWTGLMRLC